MVDQDSAVEDVRALLGAQTRISIESLSRVEASQESRGGRIELSISEDQASYPAGAAAEERAQSPSGRRGGATTGSLLPAVDEVEVARGSTFALSPMEISSIELLFPSLEAVLISLHGKDGLRVPPCQTVVCKPSVQVLICP